MEEKTNLHSEPANEISAELTEDESIRAAQRTDNQESSLDTDTSSSDYFKLQGDQPVIDNSSGLPLWERDLAEEDDFLRYMQLDEMLKTYQEDEKLRTYQMEMSNTSPSTSVAVVPAVIDETPTASTEKNIFSPNLDTLTVEIHQYLNVAKYSVIEVGKRLIQAKELVPHGEWAHWLKNNFNLKRQSATNFMHIAERFGANSQTFGNFDISTFKPSQLIALLALPKGEEETFIAQKAAEGTPVADMSVKKLRSEIKKRNASLAHQDSVSTKPVPESSDTHDTTLDMPDTLTSISHTTVPLNTDITNSSDIDHNVDNALEQLFAATATLLNSDNLQSVVNDFAENDLSTLEQQLPQMATIHSKLQHYLDIWKKTVNDNTNETT